MIVRQYCNPTASLSRSSRRLPSSFPAMSAFAAPVSAGARLRRCVSVAIGVAIVATLGCGTSRAESATVRPVIADAAHAPFAAFVAEAAQRFGIPAAWIRAVMR
ncbi:MAG TPA: lytic transglycosylase domain-containing protein, partial [Reyranella sp.]|nr:lytic transglycosylase domain-containing protein [Reyranella sp.]